MPKSDTPMRAAVSNVIPLPTARAEPVVQERKAGRLPKAVGTLWKSREEKRKRQARIAELDERWRQSLAWMKACEFALHELGARPSLMHLK